METVPVTLLTSLTPLKHSSCPKSNSSLPRSFSSSIINARSVAVISDFASSLDSATSPISWEVVKTGDMVVVVVTFGKSSQKVPVYASQLRPDLKLHLNEIRWRLWFPP